MERERESGNVKRVFRSNVRKIEREREKKKEKQRERERER